MRKVSWLLLAASGLFCLRLLGRCQVWFARPWRGDPGNHNYAVLAGEDLREALRTQMQPMLEYWLRAKVWLPLLGMNERAFRIPGIFYALCLLVVAIAVAWRHGYRRGFAVGAVVLAVGAWLSGNEWLAWEATGGRHYTLVALASVLWFSVAFLDLGLPAWVFHAASLLFVNTHFFALPLVAAGYVIRRDLKAGALVAAFTMLLNWPALDQLIFAFPAETQDPRPLSQGSWLEIAAETWKQFWFPAAWLLVALSVWLCWRRNRSFLLFPFLLVPLEIALLHWASAYPFKERYHAVFLGQFVVLVVLAFEALSRRPTLAFASLFLILVFSVPSSLKEGAFARLRVPPENFTDTWEAYRKIAVFGGARIVHEQAKGDVRLARFYLAAQGLKSPPVVSAQAAESHFLEEGTRGTIVLDGMGRKSCPAAPLQMSGGIRIVPLHQGVRCVHLVEGARTFTELAGAAARVGFPLGSESLGRSLTTVDR